MSGTLRDQSVGYRTANWPQRQNPGGMRCAGHGRFNSRDDHDGVTLPQWREAPGNSTRGIYSSKPHVGTKRFYSRQTDRAASQTRSLQQHRICVGTQHQELSRRSSGFAGHRVDHPALLWREPVIARQPGFSQRERARPVAQRSRILEPGPIRSPYHDGARR